jgi:glycosyltransferase involved in cell wall biosynthesis
MRITHLVRNLDISSVRQPLISLLAGLQAAGADVELVVLADPALTAAPLLTQAATRGIPATSIPLPDRPIRTISRTLLQAITAHLQARQPDILHTHMPYADAYGALAARRAKTPGLVSSRYAYASTRHSLPRRLFDQWLWRRFDRGIAASDLVRRYCIQAEGAQPDQIATVPYGLAPDDLPVGSGARTVLCAELGLPDNARLLGSVCALEDGAPGPSDTIKAFWHLAAQHNDAYLIIVGDGSQHAQLVQQARGYGLSERVRLTGWRQDLPAILAALDALVVACDYPGLGLLLLEAMALHTPIVAIQNTLADEFVLDGQTGFLLPSASVDHLTSTLSLLLDEPEVGQTLAAAGSEHLATTFTVARMVQGTLDVYHQVAGQG